MLTGELTEGVGSVHLSMFACSLVQRRQAGAGGGGGGGGGGEVEGRPDCGIDPLGRCRGEEGGDVL